MGAMPWQQLAPWNADPTAALRELQATFLAENYDFPRVIEEHLQGAREAVRLTEEQGDEYGILDIYKADLRYLEEIASKPLPDDPRQRIAILRKVWESGAQGIGNVLDVEEVRAEGDVHVTRRMPDKEIQKLLGTATPTRSEAEKLLGLIAEQLGRGESVCVPVYEGGEPSGWWFVGYTID